MLFSLAPLTVLAAAPLRYDSGPQQVNLLELYTSEGCSSCPPADRWLRQFSRDPRLWRQVVPMAFHVGYWDHLGWPDPFARADASDRQRQYAARHYSSTVYTPGFFHNGREWRAWFYRGEPDFDAQNVPGPLRVTVGDHFVEADFEPSAALSRNAVLMLHLAVLGFNLTTEVSAGENQGKQLRHDFVVLDLGHAQGETKGGVVTWRMPVPAAVQQPGAGAIACWISLRDDPTPLQATGGWLRSHP